MAEISQQKSILLVEDNPHDADLTCIGFKKNRITNPIVHVRNGEKALDYLLGQGKHDGRDVRDLPLVVVLDLKLPKVSGLEVLNKIRENEPTRQLPVIILTSSKEERDTTACHALGVSAYVQKPVNFLDFAEAVKKIATILAQLCEASSNELVIES